MATRLRAFNPATRLSPSPMPESQHDIERREQLVLSLISSLPRDSLVRVHKQISHSLQRDVLGACIQCGARCTTLTLYAAASHRTRASCPRLPLVPIAACMQCRKPSLAYACRRPLALEAAMRGTRMGVEVHLQSALERPLLPATSASNRQRRGHRRGRGRSLRNRRASRRATSRSGHGFRRHGQY